MTILNRKGRHSPKRQTTRNTGLPRRWAIAAICSLSALVLAPAKAQEFPSKPIHLIVPFAPGGITDISARLLASKLSERLNQSVIVENKAGGNQTIGAEYVATSPADGHTLIMGTMGSHAVNASLRKDLRFDVKTAFAPISVVTTQPLILVVNPQVATSLEELLSLMKENPGKYTYGSAGVGTTAHMAAELFQIQSGVKLVHIPYKGSGPMLTDLIGGRIDLAFDYAPTALPQVEGGRLHALAVTSAERADFSPKLPAMSEFIPNFAVTAWQGLFAPTNTPASIVDQLSKEVQLVMAMPEVVANLQAKGAKAGGNDPEEFNRFVQQEIEQWANVIRVNNIQPD